MSKHPTDPGYEESIKRAEQAFVHEFNSWLQELVNVARIGTDEERYCASEDFPKKLFALCSKYAKTELRAFAELLHRKRVRPSLIVHQLEGHCDHSVDEIIKWKLERGMEAIMDHLHCMIGLPEHYENRLKGAMEDFLRVEILPTVWLQNSEPPTMKSVVVRPRKSDPDVVKRRAIVKQNLTVKAEGLCRLFDANNVPLPNSMKEAGSWERAYRANQYRQAIHALVSRDRKSGD